MSAQPPPRIHSRTSSATHSCHSSVGSPNEFTNLQARLLNEMGDLPTDSTAAIRNSIAVLQALTQARRAFHHSTRGTAPHLQSSSATQAASGDRTIRREPDIPVVREANPPTQDRFLAEFKAQVEEQRFIGKTIHSAIQQITEDQKLMADGKNFAAWTKALKSIAANFLGSEDFFTRETQNLQDFSTSFAVFQSLKKKFKTVSFAGQINIWNQLLHFQLDTFPSTSGIASHLRNLLSDWRAINVKINSDLFLTFILFNLISQDPSIAESVTRRLEDLVQRQGVPPTFDQVVHNLEICRQQLLLTKRINSDDMPLTSTVPPSVLSADVRPSTLSLPAGAATNNIPDEFDVYAANVNQCWQCNSTSHFLRDCPVRARPNNFNRKIRGPGTFPFNPASSQIYPIIGAMYPPVNVNDGHSSFPVANGQSGAGPPFSYQRGYSNGRGFVARRVTNNQPADSYVPHPRRTDQRNNPPSQLRQSQLGASANQVDIGEIDYDFSNLNFQTLDVLDQELLEGAKPQFAELEISDSDLAMGG